MGTDALSVGVWCQQDRYACVDCSPSSDAATKAGGLAMLSAAEAMAAPQATAATTTATAGNPAAPKGQQRLTQGDLRRNKHYRAFFGLDDPRISDENLQIRSTSQCNSVVSRALGFPHVTSKAEIPAETDSGRHSASIFSDSDFHDLLDSSLPASSLKDNVFVEATKGYEPELRAAIASSGGNLQPADVLGLALEVTQGSYPLAVLTTLNLLKDVTFDGRRQPRSRHDWSALIPARTQRSPRSTSSTTSRSQSSNSRTPSWASSSASARIRSPRRTRWAPGTTPSRS